MLAIDVAVRLHGVLPKLSLQLEVYVEGSIDLISFQDTERNPFSSFLFSLFMTGSLLAQAFSGAGSEAEPGPAG